jgi:hypothetical protein
MPTNPREVDRLRRIRDQQLRARDPLIKQRKLDHTIATKHRRARTGFSFGKMWHEIPHKWRGAFLGGVLGLIALIVVPGLIPESWGMCLGVAAFPFAALIGFMIGRYEDAKEDVQDLIP